MKHPRLVSYDEISEMYGLPKRVVWDRGKNHGELKRYGRGGRTFLVMDEALERVMSRPKDERMAVYGRMSARLRRIGREDRLVKASHADMGLISLLM